MHLASHIKSYWTIKGLIIFHLQEGSGKFPNLMLSLEQSKGQEFRILGVWRERGSVLAGLDVSGFSSWEELLVCAARL